MQPSDKKSKQSLNLKAAHLEHCGRLQEKYQHDAELLDDIRMYVQQRSVIEKAYSQSLCKLVSQLMTKRQFTSETPCNNVDTNQHQFRKTIDVWRVVLEETDRVGKVRLEAAESCLDKIGNECKLMKTDRASCFKMVLERLTEIQKEVMSTAQELTKSHKSYREEQHETNEARIKAANVDAKLKSKSTGIFISRNRLEQQHYKCKSRWETCESRSTEARNEYLLNLAAANSHLLRYYNTNLPELLTTLDGDYYERIRDFLTLLAGTELTCASTTDECFQRVVDDAAKISREYNMECFLQEKPVLNVAVQYQFEPYDGDEVTQLSCDHGADQMLDEEARKWSARVVCDMRTIRTTTKQINRLTEQIQAAKSTGVDSLDVVVSSSGNISDLVAECENLNDAVRKAETSKARAEARLEVLRGAGVNVDKWLSEDLENDNDDADVNTANGRLSPVHSHSSEHEYIEVDVSSGGLGTAPLPNHRSAHGVTSSTYGDVYFGTLSGQVISEEYCAVESFPVHCVAMYNYQALNADELNLHENDNLEIIGAGDGDGWLLARNPAGDEGLVPENYIRVWNPVDDVGDSDTSEVNVDDDDIPSRHHRLAYTDGDVWVKALFDHTTVCDEELSFVEGQLISVQSRQPNGVDDGWWIGESNGRVGLFPSMMVEELSPNVTLDLQSRLQDEAVDRRALSHADRSSPATGALRSVADLRYLLTEGTESSV